MPPTKIRPLAQPDDSRSDISGTKERQPIINAHPRKGKATVAPTTATRENGSALKEMALMSNENGDVVAPGQNTGMSWSTIPQDMLDNYRIAYNIPAPAAFTSPLNQALLSNAGIGRQSTTMARRKDKRRISREQLATSVRKHFNGAAVSEIDVVVELAYKVKNQNKSFRMRSAPTGIKK